MSDYTALRLLGNDQKCVVSLCLQLVQVQTMRLL